MSVNMPVHPWTPDENHRPARFTGRIMLAALALSVLVFMLVLVIPALNSHAAMPVISHTEATVEPVMVLNTACSPFAALGPCVTTVSSNAPAT